MIFISVFLCLLYPLILKKFFFLLVHLFILYGNKLYNKQFLTLT